MDISVVVPTFQRVALIHDTVDALLKQTTDLTFEIIVVIDGSTDGTKNLLEREFKDAVVLIEQSNSGASRARNVGVESASGKIIVFLDDDMIAESNLLDEHYRWHRQGFDVVYGHIPLHPDTEMTIVSKWVGDWALERVEVIRSLGGKVPYSEMMSGQFSISKALFLSMGGFEYKFTDGGEFGNEDIDFGLRLLRHDAKIKFSESAVSWQKYSVPIGTFLRRQRECGRADVLLSKLHEEIEGPVYMGSYSQSNSWKTRLLYPVFKIVIFIAFSIKLSSNRKVEKILHWLIKYEYGKGVGDAGGF